MALWRTVLRWSALLAVLGITLLVPALLFEFGFTLERLVLLTLLAASGWVGAYAVRVDSPKLGYVGALGLIVFSFWDDLLQLVALPTAVLIVLGVLAGRRRASSESADQ